MVKVACTYYIVLLYDFMLVGVHVYGRRLLAFLAFITKSLDEGFVVTVHFLCEK